MKKSTVLLIFFMAVLLCDYGNAQFIVAGDTNSTDIVHKTLNDTLYLHVLQPGNYWSGSDTILLDLNNDGFDDFGFEAYGYYYGDSHGTSCFLIPLNNNSFCINKLPYYENQSFPDTLNFNDTIDSGNLWYSTSQKIKLASYDWILSWGEFNYGLWNDLPYKFVGLAIQLQGKFYYAWVQIQVRVSGWGAYIYLKDYAISRSNIGIKNEEKADKYRIYPNPVNELLTIELLSSDMGGVLTLYNNNAQPLITKELTGVKTELDLGSYSRGTYYLSLTTKNNTVTRKIMIE